MSHRLSTSRLLVVILVVFELSRALEPINRGNALKLCNLFVFSTKSIELGVLILDLGLDLVLELWIKLFLFMDSDYSPWIWAALMALSTSTLKLFLQHLWYFYISAPWRGSSNIVCCITFHVFSLHLYQLPAITLLFLTLPSLTPCPFLSLSLSLQSTTTATKLRT